MLLLVLKLNIRRFHYSIEKESYVEPTEIVIGQCLKKKTVKGVSILDPIKTYEQFAALSKVLKQFFSLENVLGDTL